MKNDVNDVSLLLILNISNLPLVLPLFTLKREMFAEHRPIFEQNSHGNTSTVMLELPRRHLAAQS